MLTHAERHVGRDVDIALAAATDEIIHAEELARRGRNHLRDVLVERVNGDNAVRVVGADEGVAEEAAVDLGDELPVLDHLDLLPILVVLALRDDRRADVGDGVAVELIEKDGGVMIARAVAVACELEEDIAVERVTLANVAHQGDIALDARDDAVHGTGHATTILVAPDDAASLIEHRIVDAIIHIEQHHDGDDAPDGPDEDAGGSATCQEQQREDIAQQIECGHGRRLCMLRSRSS